jgi:rhombotail lipoprotein
MSKNRVQRLALLFAIGCIPMLLSGCARFGPHRHQQSASVVQYLFPSESNPRVDAGIPTLRLPVRVGIAFVPAGEARRNYSTAAIELSDARKMELLRQVTSEFRKYDFIKSVEPIPAAYLRPGGSFENLDQLQGMFEIDIVVLLSYDQMQFSDEDFTSLAYWTIVGAYVVEGEKNDTQTLLDAVVYDIATRTLLFRAPGTSQIKGRSTPVNLSEELRRDRESGFELAAANLVTKLDAELTAFQKKVKERPAQYQVMKREGYTGSGAADWIDGLIVFVILFFYVAVQTFRRDSTEGFEGIQFDRRPRQPLRPVLARDAKYLELLAKDQP